MKITWERPSGTTIVTNDHPETLAYAKRLGWKQAEGGSKGGNRKPSSKGSTTKDTGAGL